MEGITLYRPDDSAAIKKVLFERPISRLQSRKIGILAGKHASLKKVNDIFEIITALHHEPVLVAEHELKDSSVPANVFLEVSHKATQSYTNTDEALEAFADCSYVIIGMDIEIGSTMQIFLERLISIRNAPIVFTTQSISLFKISPQLLWARKSDIFACNTKSLIDLANFIHLPTKFKPSAGIYNKLGLMQSLATQLSANIFCVEDYQILASCYAAPDKVAVIALKNASHTQVDYLFIALFISLLCDSTNPEYDMLERTLTGGYLLKAGLEGKDTFVANVLAAIRN
jgi:hypothetical protein